MYGDQCCYIHPSIPCKFGFYCTRIGCSYSHPQGFNPGMGIYPNMMQSVPFKKYKKNIRGRKQEKLPIVNQNEEKNENKQKLEENEVNASIEPQSEEKN